MTAQMLVTGLVSLLSVSDFGMSSSLLRTSNLLCILALGHGGPELSVHERAMHPQELASRQVSDLQFRELVPLLTMLP
jgi:hypothetical protein